MQSCYNCLFEEELVEKTLVEDEVTDNEDVADKQNTEELIEKTLVEDEVIDNEEVSTNENDEVIREETGVEKIIDDGVNCGNDEQGGQTTGAKTDEKPKTVKMKKNIKMMMRKRKPFYS
ncbi:hypothetical protein L1987_77858 [Smallanthus sonchifolius]|uniref:Uncharacterized protein n=1 Tax=Smallanthus sonchifolius TaxID=185202 RepID=A0ACB8ZAR5_9ASTR|nr:hypothetical protein L1987_77858 [Smallanthus sonchifolius]